MGFSPSFVGGSGGMLPRKIFENWNAGKRISGIRAVKLRHQWK